MILYQAHNRSQGEKRISLLKERVSQIRQNSVSHRFQKEYHGFSEPLVGKISEIVYKPFV